MKLIFKLRTNREDVIDEMTLYSESLGKYGKFRRSGNGVFTFRFYFTKFKIVPAKFLVFLLRKKQSFTLEFK